MSPPRICVVCTASAQYRCPVCSASCSLTCYKEHKVSRCSVVTVSQDQLPSNELHVPAESTVAQLLELETTADYVPIRKLELLKQSEQLKMLLKNPHLRSYLTKLNDSLRPDLSMSAALREPLFVEFADECLRVINSE
ncbi:Zinc finger HIT domain-containing protein 3 [Fasciolopsis buskii]|uniref:Zinc finger HIT domain-containing protein 3 n=1 Tax=Fasciolopsis buskii TaxID=27845 RepID=A0A8E0S655_9TREM|nr:Zinc finger HIT domain-containing protein 3 [Fasciolopsis buski]